MKPTAAQREALELAASDPDFTIIRPFPGRFWIRNGQEGQLMESTGPQTDPPSVANAIAMACWRANWLYPIRSMFELETDTPRRLRLTAAGIIALKPENR